MYEPGFQKIDLTDERNLKFSIYMIYRAMGWMG